VTIWTAAFWKAAAERAIKTFAQALVAFLAVGTGLLDVDWVAAASVAGMAALLSLLTSIGSDLVSPTPGPSLVGETLTGEDA